MVIFTQMLYYKRLYKYLSPMKISITILLSLAITTADAQQNLVQYVHPLIGTEKWGIPTHRATALSAPYNLAQIRIPFLMISTEGIMAKYINIVPVTGMRTKPLQGSVIRILAERGILTWAIF